MIGLGSNRLTVCRRGGMSVTQAGRGGMEWLAGYRDPIWASPYSAQATAALKAQFPTQWPTIRDYGFAHPEIVPLVNERPIAYGTVIVYYDIVPSIRTNGAMADSGIVLTTLAGLKIECDFKVLSKKSGVNGMWGYMTGGGSVTPRFSLFFDTNAQDAFGTGYNATTYFTTKAVVGSEYTSVLDNGTLILNGESASVGTGAMSNVPLFIGARGNASRQAQWPTDIALSKFNVSSNGAELFRSVMVKRKSDNEYGLFDVINIAFKPSIVSTKFSETPAS